jgi:hypothetical protein
VEVHSDDVACRSQIKLTLTSTFPSFLSAIANMSVSGFLSSIADKAQNALGNSPISQHNPGASRPSAGTSSAPTDNHKSHALGQIQHQFRQLQQNYS